MQKVKIRNAKDMIVDQCEEERTEKSAIVDLFMYLHIRS